MNTFDELTCGVSIHAYQMLLNTITNDLGVEFRKAIIDYLDDLNWENDSPQLRTKIGVSLECFTLTNDDRVTVRKMLDKFPTKDPIVMAVITGILFDFIYHHKTEMTDVLLEYLNISTDLSNNSPDPRFN
jgi:hypothetical protein